MSQISKPVAGAFGENEAVAFVPAFGNREGCFEKTGSNHRHPLVIRQRDHARILPTPISGRTALPSISGFLDRQGARIALRSRGKILLLDPREIVAVEAQGNYVMLRSQNDSHLLRESISLMAEKLKRYGLLRIHRSVLVNRFYVEEIRPWSTGEYGVRLRDGKEYTLTRTYKAVMEHFADLWF